MTPLQSAILSLAALRASLRSGTDSLVHEQRALERLAHLEHVGISPRALLLLRSLRHDEAVNVALVSNVIDELAIALLAEEPADSDRATEPPDELEVTAEHGPEEMAWCRSLLDFGHEMRQEER